MKTHISTLISWILACLMTSSWAVDLPRTGQTSCHDAYGSPIACAGAGHDGATLAGVPLINPRFTNHGNGTVTDNMTGLMWSQDANLPAGTKTWQQALDYVASMNAGNYANFGYTDWRLPNVVELLSLVNHENTSPAITTGHPFTNVQSGSTIFYYTSTTTFSGFASSPGGGAWLAQFGTGSLGAGNKAGTRYVWPVRTGSGGRISLQKTGRLTSYAMGDDGDLEVGLVSPAYRFITHNNGAVTDRFTGLMWTENSNLSNGTWQQALDYVANMNTGSNTNFGYTDWRLPNIVDLRSLLDIENLNPALPTGHPFTNTTGSRWSSTSIVSTPTKAWSSGVNAGHKAAENKSASRGIWPVRSLLALRLPLPGGKNWELTTEVGGTLYCNRGINHYHTGNGYYSLDFNDLSEQNGLETDVPIYAAADGTVDPGDYGYDASGYGHWVRINHGKGYKTLYAHMTAQSLILSGAVNRGDQLGTIGDTGSSDGSHLHFQVSYNGSSASTVPELGLVLMEGLTLNEYVVGCRQYYTSTNTQ